MSQKVKLLKHGSLYKKTMFFSLKAYISSPLYTISKGLLYHTHSDNLYVLYEFSFHYNVNLMENQPSV